MTNPAIVSIPLKAVYFKGRFAYTNTPGGAGKPPPGMVTIFL
jgi:hypothetical protein